MKQEHHFVVQDAQTGLRLDQFLASTHVVSRRKARGLLADGSVYLNRRRVKVASRRVRTGDRVTCYLQTTPRSATEGTLGLLYQDSHLVVVNKPAGMAVQATVESDRGTVLSALRIQLGGGPVRPRVVHRLDRPASGALVVALTREAAAGLSDMMARHQTDRQYLAVVEGRCSMEARLAHYLTPPSRGSSRFSPLGRVAVRPLEGDPGPDERQAVTVVKPLIAGEQFSLLNATIETGRTHQVRAQLAFEGFPIAGDFRYGARTALPDLTGIALHAWKLEFRHPVTSARIAVTAPLPGPIQAWIESLDRSSGTDDSLHLVSTSMRDETWQKS